MVNMHSLLTRNVRLTNTQQYSSGVGAKPRSKFSAGKALTTASAAKQGRTAKGEKRIVIELGTETLEVRLSVGVLGQLTRTYVFLYFLRVLNSRYRAAGRA